MATVDIHWCPPAKVGQSGSNAPCKGVILIYADWMSLLERRLQLLWTLHNGLLRSKTLTRSRCLPLENSISRIASYQTPMDPRMDGLRLQLCHISDPSSF